MICCFTPADGIAEITAAPIRSAFGPPLLLLGAGCSDSAHRRRLRGEGLAGQREGRLCVALKGQGSLQVIIHFHFLPFAASHP